MKTSKIQLFTLIVEVLIIVRLLLTLTLAQPSTPDRQESSQSVLPESQASQEVEQMPALP
jgi:hypothetical protein